MAKNLLVPYKSQWDADASGTYNDCGPASAAMILNYYGNNFTTDEIYKKTGAGSGLISWTQLINAIQAVGYVPHLERNQTLDTLRAFIDKDTPPIVLVHYGSLTSTQDKKFKGGHFFVPVGYYADGFFVNDPNFKAPIRQDGDHHNYLTEEFLNAWRDTMQDGNQPFSLLWIERKASPPVPQPPGDTIITDPKAKIDLGEDIGVQELQAIRSIITDLRRDLAAEKTNNDEAIKQITKLDGEIVVLKSEKIQLENDLKDSEKKHTFNNKVASFLFDLATAVEGRKQD